ncbi:MAG: hypothetical protein JW776_12880 [Candidatus Lokiarchaeota archaeon]|nr:hypothetical protein [Candidatus Lokiarchaeota archaeon]
MEQNYKNRWFGFTLAIIGAFLGIGLNAVIFFTQYDAMIAAQLAQYPLRTNWKIIKYLLPIWASLGFVGGFLYIFGLYGFVTERSYAYKISMIANVFALQFSFWPIIPAMDTGMTPYYALIFLPNALIYLLLNFLVGKKNFGRIILGLMTGMALVMSVINGTASLNIFWMKGELFYIIANPLHWSAGICFALITIGVMLSPKKWVRILAMCATILEMGVGIPMGIITTIEKGEFSMYLAAPAMSLIILLIVVIPYLWDKIVKPENLPRE